MKTTKKCILLAILVLLLLCLSGCGKPTIDMNDYLTITCSGYDGYGTAEYSIDLSALQYDNQEAFQDRNYESTDIAALDIDLYTYVKGVLDKTDDLSNGDKVTFKWNLDGMKRMQERYNIKFKFDDCTVKVKDLEAVADFDPFEYIDVTYYGISGQAFANIDSSNLPLCNLYFDVAPTEELKNGDIITVTVKSYSDDITKLLGEKGLNLIATEKTYTVGGLNEYVSHLAQIPKDTYDKMDAQAQDVFRAGTASWENPKSLTDIKLLGNYLLTRKDDMYGYQNNILYYVYEIEIDNEETNSHFTYYYCVAFHDILLMSDGTCTVDLGSYERPGIDFIVDNLFYMGFQNLETMFNSCILPSVEYYQYTTNIEE